MTGKGGFWLVLGAIVGVVLVVLGWFVGAAPLFGQASRADVQRSDVEAVNAAEEAELAEMRELAEREDELRAEFELLQVSVPSTRALEAYYDWLAVAANNAGVALTSVTVANATLYGAAEASELPPGLEPPVLPGPDLQDNLFLLPLTISLNGDFEQVRAFVAAMQGDGRLQLVNEVDARFGTTLSATIGGYLFVVHDPRNGPVGTIMTAEEDEPTPETTESPAPAPADPTDPATAPTEEPTP